MDARAASVADVGRVNGPCQGYYRVHGKSMQHTIHAGLLSDLEGRLDAFRNVLVGPSARLAHGAELFATARRALALSALGYARLAYEHGRAELEPVDEYLGVCAARLAAGDALTSMVGRGSPSRAPGEARRAQHRVEEPSRHDGPREPCSLAAVAANRDLTDLLGVAELVSSSRRGAH